MAEEIYLKIYLVVFTIYVMTWNKSIATELYFLKPCTVVQVTHSSAIVPLRIVETNTQSQYLLKPANSAQQIKTIFFHRR